MTQKVTDNEANARREYNDGLRQLADFLDAHPEVPLPYMGSYQTGTFQPTMSIILIGDDQKEILADIARAMGTAAKRVDDDRFRQFGGIALSVSASREQVCERVVVGTHEEIVEEPDAEALAAVPTRKVTKVVEDVEWKCTPLLAAADCVHDCDEINCSNEECAMCPCCGVPEAKGGSR